MNIQSHLENQDFYMYWKNLHCIKSSSLPIRFLILNIHGNPSAFLLFLKSFRCWICGFFFLWLLTFRSQVITKKSSNDNFSHSKWVEGIMISFFGKLRHFGLKKCKMGFWKSKFPVQFQVLSLLQFRKFTFFCPSLKQRNQYCHIACRQDNVVNKIWWFYCI